MHLFAYLDDIVIVGHRDVADTAFDVVSQCLQEMCGLVVSPGKTHVWSQHPERRILYC